MATKDPLARKPDNTPAPPPERTVPTAWPTRHVGDAAPGQHTTALPRLTDLLP